MNRYDPSAGIDDTANQELIEALKELRADLRVDPVMDALNAPEALSPDGLSFLRNLVMPPVVEEPAFNLQKHLQSLQAMPKQDEGNLLFMPCEGCHTAYPVPVSRLTDFSIAFPADIAEDDLLDLLEGRSKRRETLEKAFTEWFEESGSDNAKLRTLALNLEADAMELQALADASDSARDWALERTTYMTDVVNDIHAYADGNKDGSHSLRTLRDDVIEVALARHDLIQYLKIQPQNKQEQERKLETAVAAALADENTADAVPTTASTPAPVVEAPAANAAPSTAVESDEKLAFIHRLKRAPDETPLPAPSWETEMAAMRSLFAKVPGAGLFKSLAERFKNSTSAHAIMAAIGSFPLFKMNQPAQPLNEDQIPPLPLPVTEDPRFMNKPAVELGLFRDQKTTPASETVSENNEDASDSPVKSRINGVFQRMTSLLPMAMAAFAPRQRTIDGAVLTDTSFNELATKLLTGDNLVAYETISMRLRDRKHPAPYKTAYKLIATDNQEWFEATDAFVHAVATAFEPVDIQRLRIINSLMDSMTEEAKLGEKLRVKSDAKIQKKMSAARQTSVQLVRSLIKQGYTLLAENAPAQGNAPLNDAEIPDTTTSDPIVTQAMPDEGASPQETQSQDDVQGKAATREEQADLDAVFAPLLPYSAGRTARVSAALSDMLGAPEYEHARGVIIHANLGRGKMTAARRAIVKATKDYAMATYAVMGQTGKEPAVAEEELQVLLNTTKGYVVPGAKLSERIGDTIAKKMDTAAARKAEEQALTDEMQARHRHNMGSLPSDEAAAYDTLFTTFRKYGTHEADRLAIALMDHLGSDDDRNADYAAFIHAMKAAYVTRSDKQTVALVTKAVNAIGTHFGKTAQVDLEHALDPIIKQGHNLLNQEMVGSAETLVIDNFDHARVLLRQTLNQTVAEDVQKIDQLRKDTAGTYPVDTVERKVDDSIVDLQDQLVVYHNILDVDHPTENAKFALKHRQDLNDAALELVSLLNQAQLDVDHAISVRSGGGVHEEDNKTVLNYMRDLSTRLSELDATFDLMIDMHNRYLNLHKRDYISQQIISAEDKAAFKAAYVALTRNTEPGADQRALELYTDMLISSSDPDATHQAVMAPIAGNADKKPLKAFLNKLKYNVSASLDYDQHSDKANDNKRARMEHRIKNTGNDARFALSTLVNASPAAHPVSRAEEVRRKMGITDEGHEPLIVPQTETTQNDTPKREAPIVTVATQATDNTDDTNAQGQPQVVKAEAALAPATPAQETPATQEPPVQTQPVKLAPAPNVVKEALLADKPQLGQPIKGRVAFLVGKGADAAKATVGWTGAVIVGAAKKWPIMVVGVGIGVFAKGALVGTVASGTGPLIATMAVGAVVGMYLARVSHKYGNYLTDDYRNNKAGVNIFSGQYWKNRGTELWATAQAVANTSVAGTIIAAGVALAKAPYIAARAYSDTKKDIWAYKNVQGEKLGVFKKIGMMLGHMNRIDAESTAMLLGAVAGGIGAGVGYEATNFVQNSGILESAATPDADTTPAVVLNTPNVTPGPNPDALQPTPLDQSKLVIPALDAPADGLPNVTPANTGPKFGPNVTIGPDGLPYVEGDTRYLTTPGANAGDAITPADTTPPTPIVPDAPITTTAAFLNSPGVRANVEFWQGEIDAGRIRTNAGVAAVQKALDGIAEGKLQDAIDLLKFRAEGRFWTPSGHHALGYAPNAEAVVEGLRDLSELGANTDNAGIRAAAIEGTETLADVEKRVANAMAKAAAPANVASLNGAGVADIINADTALRGSISADPVMVPDANATPTMRAIIDGINKNRI